MDESEYIRKKLDVLQIGARSSRFRPSTAVVAASASDEYVFLFGGLLAFIPRKAGWHGRR